MVVRNCPSCGGEASELGFMMNTGARNGYDRWARGALETGAMGGARTMGRDKLDVQARRCVRCGHLELFAL